MSSEVYLLIIAAVVIVVWGCFTVKSSIPAYAFLIAFGLSLALSCLFNPGIFASKTCPSCNYDVDPTYSYCPDCGAPISAPASGDAQFWQPNETP